MTALHCFLEDQGFWHQKNKSHITVSARFRLLSTKERGDHGDNVSVQSLDSETFVFKVVFH